MLKPGVMDGTDENERKGMPSTSPEAKQHQGPFDGLSHLAGGLEVGPTPTDDYEEVSDTFSCELMVDSKAAHMEHTHVHLHVLHYNHSGCQYV